MNRPRPTSFTLLFSLAAGLTTLVACQPAGEDDPATPGAGGSVAGTGGKAGGTGGPTAGGSGGSISGGSGGSSGGSGGTVGGTGGSTPGSGGSASGGATGTGGADGGSPPVDASGVDGAPAGGGGAPAAGVPVPSEACAGGALMPGPNGAQQVMATGKNRSFIVRLPAGYDGKKPFPMLLSFHGANASGASFENGPFAAVSRMAADRAIRIYPNGLGNGWSRDEPDDVLFMDAMMGWLKTRVCYDTARVYAAGQSSGAYFSHRLACDRGSLIRAIATNSGGQRRERALADCKSPVAAWISAGAADNPGHVMGAQQARDMWATRNGCATGAMPVQPSPCQARTGCMPGYPVVHCQHGGGHAIPGYGPAGIVGFLLDSKF